MLDFLEFIEKRLLRMGPTNRAECDEIVEKLAAFEKDCSGDRQYCTRRMKKRPARSSTELSLLRPAPLEFSRETDKRIQRNPPPLYTGPVETDTDPYNDQDSVASTSKRSSRDFGLSERFHHEPEAMAEPRTAVGAPLMAAFQRAENEVTASSASHVDPMIPRAQFSYRKVHFPPGRPKERTASMRDLHDIPAEDEPLAEMAPSIPSLPNPSTTKPSIPPEAHFGQESPRLSDSLAESTESRLGPTQADPTINEHEPAVEENPGVQDPFGNPSAQDQSVANAPSSESQTLDNTGVSHGEGESDRTDDRREPSPVIAPQGTNGHTMGAKETDILSSEHAKPERASAKLKTLFRRLWCFTTD
jgi:hypothetical protein